MKVLRDVTFWVLIGRFKKQEWVKIKEDVMVATGSFSLFSTSSINASKTHRYPRTAAGAGARDPGAAARRSLSARRSRRSSWYAPTFRRTTCGSSASTEDFA